jgi:hypothetical protein
MEEIVTDQSVLCHLDKVRKRAEAPGVVQRKGRSKVTNGKSLFVEFEGDSRGPWTRRFRDVLSQIIDDITPPEGLSEGQRQLARRAATIALACEKLEGEAAAGKDIDLEVYGKLVDRLGRTFQRLGLRRARDTTSSLGRVLRAGIERHQREASC